MSTTYTTPTAATLLREQVTAKAETIAEVMAAYDRNPDRWTCTRAGECAGPHECGTASDLQAEHGGGCPDDAMRELPVSVAYERGRLVSVLLTAGGPRVEIVPHPTRPRLSRIVGRSLGADPVTMAADTVTAYAEWWADMA